MRVAIITELGSWSASTRARALLFVPGLRSGADVVDVFLAPKPSKRKPGRVGQVRYFALELAGYVRRWFHLHRSILDYDALFIQRGLYGLGPGAIARTVEKFPGRVILDLDDEVFSRRHGGPLRQWLYGPQQTKRILARADAVVVSTTELRKRLPVKGDSAVVLPTILRVADYAVAVHQPGQTRIGWAGTNGGLQYLDALSTVFEELERRGSGFLEVVSSRPWGGPSQFRQWRLDDEPELFARFAVGIMPLPNTAYARSKAGFKLLQYMAAGVPVVASPVGVNEELVESSGAGFLASSPKQWLEKLEVLLGDPDLRVTMGKAGRRFVTTFADVDGHAAVLGALIHGE